MSGSMQQVLETKELLELILEYAASGRKWKEACELRLVCKSWRDCSFRGLCASTNLPAVDMSTYDSEDKAVNNKKAIAKFQKQYPPDALLPISLTLQEPYDRTTYDFLSAFGSAIAELRIYMPQERVNVGSCRRPPLYLKNMRKLIIINDWVLNYPINYQRAAEFLQNVIKNAKKLNHFMFSFHAPPSGDCRIQIPAKITHLELVNLTVAQIEILISNNEFSRLIALDISILQSERKAFELKGLEMTRIFPNLENLKITSGASHPYNATCPIVLPQIIKLKQLRASLDVFVTPGSLYANIKTVVLFLTSDFYITEVYQTIKENGLPPCPGLESATIYVPEPVLFEMMPKLFSTWKAIKVLNLKGRRTLFETQRRSSTYDLVQVLTGIEQKQIPLDELLWHECLHGNITAVTNLKYLETLSINISGRSQRCKLDSFVFKAGFLTMEHLKCLELSCIVVVHEMVRAWKAEGRELDGDYTVYSD